MWEDISSFIRFEKNTSDKLESCLSQKTCLLSFYSSKECITLTMVNP